MARQLFVALVLLAVVGAAYAQLGVQKKRHDSYYDDAEDEHEGAYGGKERHHHTKERHHPRHGDGDDDEAYYSYKKEHKGSSPYYRTSPHYQPAKEGEGYPQHRRYALDLGVALGVESGRNATLEVDGSEVGEELILLVDLYDGPINATNKVGSAAIIALVTDKVGNKTSASVQAHVQLTAGDFKGSKLAATGYITWDTADKKVNDEFLITAGSGKFFGGEGTVTLQGGDMRVTTLALRVLVPMAYVHTEHPDY